MYQVHERCRFLSWTETMNRCYWCILGLHAHAIYSDVISFCTDGSYLEIQEIAFEGVGFITHSQHKFGPSSRIWRRIGSQIQGTRQIMSVDVKQQIKIRGNHRTYVSKLLKWAPEVAPDDEEQIELLRISLKGKLSVLEDLDNSILELVEEGNIDKQIEESEGIKDEIHLNLLKLDSLLKELKTPSQPSEPSPVYKSSSYQPPPQALRFSHRRRERETRVTGDEPQGTMGRVQTAGEAPARSCVVFLAKKSFSWHGPIFGLFKSWKRSILVAYCCKHCKLWVDRKMA